MLQQRLLDLWVGDRQDLCVVGTRPRRSISSRGRPSLLTRLPRRYPQATVVELPTTFRCDQAIAAAANALARDIPGSAAASVAPAGGMVRVRSHESDGAEARPWPTRSSSLLAAGHAAPGDRLSAVPDPSPRSDAGCRCGAAEVAYSTRGGDQFYERPEVREALIRYRGELRGASQGWPPRSWRWRLAASGPRGRRPRRPRGSGGSRWRRWPRCSTTTRQARRRRAAAAMGRRTASHRHRRECRC